MNVNPDAHTVISQSTFTTRTKDTYILKELGMIELVEGINGV